MPEYEEIFDPKYVLVGEKLVCVARKIGKPRVRKGSSAHRTQEVTAEGTQSDPARCFIAKVARIVRDKF